MHMPDYMQSDIFADLKSEQQHMMFASMDSLARISLICEQGKQGKASSIADVLSNLPADEQASAITACGRDTISTMTSSMDSKILMSLMENTENTLTLATMFQTVTNQTLHIEALSSVGAERSAELLLVLSKEQSLEVLLNMDRSYAKDCIKFM